MEEYEIVVTDVTEYGELRCVAGWDVGRQRMIRPEPAAAAFWPSAQVGPSAPFHPGHVVRFKATPPPTRFPHRTDDRVVVGPVSVVAALNIPDFVDLLRLIPANSPALLRVAPIEFNDGNPFIASDTECPSLFTLNTSATNLTFREKTYESKRTIRCLIDTGNGVADISIASAALRGIYRQNGLAGVSGSFGAGTLQLRIGTARGWGSYPDRCYIQLNDAYAI